MFTKIEKKQSLQSQINIDYQNDDFMWKTINVKAMVKYENKFEIEQFTWKTRKNKIIELFKCNLNVFLINLCLHVIFNSKF